MKKYKMLTIISIIIIILDQISKVLISTTLDLYESINIIPNFFKLTYTRNFGAAWSIMQNKRLFLVIVTIIALIFIFYLIYKEKKLTKFKMIYYGFLIGGIFGNFIDRISCGYVIDFLDFNIFGYNFPVFNISDSFIVIGVIMILLENFVGGEKHEWIYGNRRR